MLDEDDTDVSRYIVNRYRPIGEPVAEWRRWSRIVGTILDIREKLTEGKIGTDDQWRGLARDRWRDVLSAGHLAEIMVIQNAHATAGLKECWKHRLQVLKKDLGYDGAPMLEQLLIQQTALCWLKLNLVELGYSNTMKQSITLTLGVYWEKRLSAAQRRFTRACETLARVRKLSRNTPALQFNIAASGGQQVNVAS